MKIIAHRGNDGIHMENSMEAILNSLSQEYVDGIEIDIRITKDNKFIINHDPFYYGLFISNTKAKKLQQKGLNTLEEVLQKIDNQKIILIEIKEETNNFKILNNRLYNLLKKYNLNYYICSFNYDLIIDFYKKYPDIKTGLIIGTKTNKNKINNVLDFNSINYKLANQIRDKETFIWTVNSEEELKNIKFNNIITDKTKYMSDLFNKLSI